jgi:hypothetical protein
VLENSGGRRCGARTRARLSLIEKVRFASTFLREAVPSVHRGEAAYPRGDGSLVVLPPADLRADAVRGSGVPQSLAPFESAEAELEADGSELVASHSAAPLSR